jgi:histidinol-phosphate/aromatic aminotransferase/cobyric acid decarboxylase-like protein
VLINEPTFALYRQITTVLGGEVISLPLNAALSYDVAKLKDTVGDLQPEVTIVCSPNNPTGCMLSDDDLRLLLESTNGLVVVDEAYHEFAEHSVVPLLREHDNLVVLRTFSKATAMAGLRAGVGDRDTQGRASLQPEPYFADGRRSGRRDVRR